MLVVRGADRIAKLADTLCAAVKSEHPFYPSAGCGILEVLLLFLAVFPALKLSASYLTPLKLKTCVILRSDSWYCIRV